MDMSFSKDLFDQPIVVFDHITNRLAGLHKILEFAKDRGQSEDSFSKSLEKISKLKIDSLFPGNLGVALTASKNQVAVLSQLHTNFSKTTTDVFTNLSSVANDVSNQKKEFFAKFTKLKAKHTLIFQQNQKLRQRQQQKSREAELLWIKLETARRAARKLRPHSPSFENNASITAAQIASLSAGLGEAFDETSFVEYAELSSRSPDFEKLFQNAVAVMKEAKIIENQYQENMKPMRDIEKKLSIEKKKMLEELQISDTKILALIRTFLLEYVEEQFQFVKEYQRSLISLKNTVQEVDIHNIISSFILKYRKSDEPTPANASFGPSSLLQTPEAHHEFERPQPPQQKATPLGHKKLSKGLFQTSPKFPPQAPQPVAPPQTQTPQANANDGYEYEVKYQPYVPLYFKAKDRREKFFQRLKKQATEIQQKQDVPMERPHHENLSLQARQAKGGMQRPPINTLLKIQYKADNSNRNPSKSMPPSPLPIQTINSSNNSAVAANVLSPANTNNPPDFIKKTQPAYLDEKEVLETEEFFFFQHSFLTAILGRPPKTEAFPQKDKLPPSPQNQFSPPPAPNKKPPTPPRGVVTPEKDDPKLKETILQKANRLVDEGPKGRIAFCVAMNLRRNESRITTFNNYLIITKLVKKTLKLGYENRDPNVGRLLVNMCQTYYYWASREETKIQYEKLEKMTEDLEANGMIDDVLAGALDDSTDGRVKIYLQHILRQNSVFQDSSFWREAFFETLSHESHKIKKPSTEYRKLDNKMRKEKAAQDENVAFGLLGSFAVNMLSFGCSAEKTKEFMSMMCVMNFLEDPYSEMLVSLVDSTYENLSSMKDEGLKDDEMLKEEEVEFGETKEENEDEMPDDIDLDVDEIEDDDYDPDAIQGEESEGNNNNSNNNPQLSSAGAPSSLHGKDPKKQNSFEIQQDYFLQEEN